ncbi:MAG: twin-arginine translocase TatA/TatE family subunit [Anaerolineae bacterium]|nr:twin-arginine translocase TatA/TatE family subunit [Anaerolineae bacterium]NIN94058.1 twin-arginine translocase TatA/TatE family subunit [Anaerolineae bacterium]NIQ77099.1 twin-arginine translocase TatA/TatE family subunit [Anaerolineae bacterium]
MNFAGVGPAELLFILIIALLVFGPKKLPELARDLGKSIAKWRQALEEIQTVTDVSPEKLLTPLAKEQELQASVQQVVRRKEEKEVPRGEEVGPRDKEAEEVKVDSQ